MALLHWLGEMWRPSNESSSRRRRSSPHGYWKEGNEAQALFGLETMKQRKSSAPQFAVCIDNAGYPASLELRKIYQVLPDEKAAKHNLVRVIDESGEDYLYPAEFFIVIEIPKEAERALSLAS